MIVVGASFHLTTPPLHNLATSPLHLLSNPAKMCVLKIILILQSIPKDPVHCAVTEEKQTGELQVRVTYYQPGQPYRNSQALVMHNII
jgi:hypothetical protein